MKKFRIVFLVVFLLILSCVCSYAASTTETQCADALYELGLFKGTGTNADGTPIYSLDKTPTRAEAITMLVRLLGKEEEAKARDWETPFTDVEEWAKPYVGYAYNNGLTTGTSATTFGGTEKATETQYLTFVLRALGYSDKDGDFSWDKAKEFTNKLDITYGDADTKFLRGDIAEISYMALKAKLKDSDTKLIDSLYETGAVKTSEIAKVVRDKVSEDGTKIYLPDEAREGLSYDEIAKGYGFEDLYYTVNPKTEEEHWNNVRYVMLTGQWDYKKNSLRDDRKKTQYKWTAIKHNGSYEGAYLECALDGALMSYFSHGTMGVFFYYDSNGYHVTTDNNDIDKFLTPEEISNQIIESYLVAREKYDEFREKGLITESSTQYEIAKVYADWFSSVNFVFPSDAYLVGDEHAPDWDLDISAPYRALVLNTAKCDTKAHAFCLLMRMEGITSYGLVCGGSGDQVNGSQEVRIGHSVPWLLLDGEEYIYEHNMGIGLLKVNKGNASAGTTVNTIHYFQKYHYNQILKRTGLVYDKNYDDKSYWDDDGNALTRNEWIKYEKSMGRY